MPILGFSCSAANTDVINIDKWGYNSLIEYKILWEKKKLPVMSNFFFFQNVFKSCLLLMHQNEFLWSKGLNGIVLSRQSSNTVAEIAVQD